MIVFKEQPEKLPVQAFNNSVIKFETDSGTPKLSTIEVAGFTFTIFPDASGEFYYNFREVVQVLINQNLFSDEVEIESASKFLYQDSTLYYNLEATISIEKTDSTSESVTKSWPFIKSVNQFDRGRYENPGLMLLHPGEASLFRLTYFEGWPFDVSVYSSEVRTVTIRSKRTGQSTNQTLQKGVNRIFISNGENDKLGFENVLPLYNGVNELEFLDGGSLQFTLLLNKKSSECGQLIKWFNQAGGWSYWLLQPLYIQELKASTQERINTDFESLYDSVGNYSITGRSTEKAREYVSGLMDAYERNVFEEMISSPKVYYYNSGLAQRFEKTNFIEVEATGGTFKSGNKANLEEYKVKLEFPKYYTQKI